MANITNITSVSSWSFREILTASKMMAQMTAKSNLLKDNLDIIHVARETLLPGSGADQAKIPFFHVSAPPGWERDVAFSDDTVLRITDGTTVPPGDSPTAVGGVEGGDWTTHSAATSAHVTHTHDIDNHVHSLQSHTHTGGSHFHNMSSHFHTFFSGGQHLHTVDNEIVTTSVSTTSVGDAGAGVQVAADEHTHDINTHTHNDFGLSDSPFSTYNSGSIFTGATAPATQASTGDTQTTSGTTDADGATAGHTITFTSSWRPVYTNILICKKTDDAPTLDLPDDVGPWFVGEHPSYNKMTTELTSKINDLIDEHVVVDNTMRALLLDSDSGADQAKIPFLVPSSSAPTGWDRDFSFTGESVLRVTTGAGGGTGGTWTVPYTVGTGGIHTHAFGSHSHTMTHTHIIAHDHTTVHTHRSTHSHPSGTNFIGGLTMGTPSTALDIVSVGGPGRSTNTHTHTTSSSHNHTISGSHDAATGSESTSGVGTPTPNNSGLVSGDTGTASGTTGAADYSGSPTHVHTSSFTPGWRPTWRNTIVCKKQVDTSLISVTDSSVWRIREAPVSSKFTAQLTNKLNGIIDNHEVTNTNLENLLQGTSGGSEQARIPFAKSSAPAGWTRDNSITDQLLRVADGPGTGDATGGSWVVSGVAFNAAGDHNHTANHTHDITHNHGSVSHTHNVNNHTHALLAHTHSINTGSIFVNSDGSVNGTGNSGGSDAAQQGHSHTTAPHNHGGTANLSTDKQSSSMSSPTTGSTSLTFGAASITTSGNASPATVVTNGSHGHTLSHDGLWRPKYLNVIVCSKD